MTVTIEISVHTGNRKDCTYSHPKAQYFEIALNELQNAAFEIVPTAGKGEFPEVTVTIEMYAGGFVRDGGGSPSPERHPQRYYLPSADLDQTKAALKAMGL